MFDVASGMFSIEGNAPLKFSTKLAAVYSGRSSNVAVIGRAEGKCLRSIYLAPAELEGDTIKTLQAAEEL